MAYSSPERQKNYLANYYETHRKRPLKRLKALLDALKLLEPGAMISRDRILEMVGGEEAQGA